jgi:hypothetical protein
LNHYSKFEGETEETAYEFYDLYIETINPNLIVVIRINSPKNNANEIIKGFINYKIS